MKRFFKQIILFLVILFAASMLLDVLYTTIISNSSERNKVENVIHTKHKKYDVILLAVAHHEFITLDFNKIKKENTVIFDAKAILNRDIVDSRL